MLELDLIYSDIVKHKRKSVSAIILQVHKGLTAVNYDYVNKHWQLKVQFDRTMFTTQEIEAIVTRAIEELNSETSHPDRKLEASFLAGLTSIRHSNDILMRVNVTLHGIAD